MKTALTLLIMGAFGVLHAQQSVDPPLSSSAKDRMENGSAHVERTIPNASIQTIHGEKPLTDFRKGNSSQLSASEVLGLSSSLRQAVLMDLENYNVVAGKVNNSQVDNLPESEQEIVGKNPAVFLVENNKEDKR